MKILLCNKFYYRRGGDCIYTMNLEQLLKSHGHEVAIFSQQYPLNEPSPWSKYWPSEFKMKPSLNMIDSLLRPFGLGSVQKHFKAILDNFQPDVVHLNNIHTQLSPILAELAHQRGIRVVWTIHDSKLVCPCYTCMRDGNWCEDCFSDKRAVLRHKCMSGGKLGAYIGYQEAMKWTAERLMKSVDYFICPSDFMAQILKKGGYDRSKLTVLSNFIDHKKVMNPNHAKSDFFLYVGRINAEKGLPTLCEAAAQIPYRLKIVGSGELEKPLRNQYTEAKNIEWLGQKQWQEIRPLLEQARFVVLPAEWSENNPLSIIESLTLGTPVLGANIGGIPELLNKHNGMTFESGNAEALKTGIEAIWKKQDFDYTDIARKALTLYSDTAYYARLSEIYRR